MPSHRSSAKSFTKSQLAERLDSAKKGDIQALNDLFVHYRSFLKLLASIRTDRLLRKKLSSSDLVQDACTQLLKDFDNFRGESIGEFEAFLRNILASCKAKVVRRYFTSQRRNVRLEQELAAGLEESAQLFALPENDPSGAPLEALLRQESKAALSNALCKLSESRREVVVLHGIEGLTLREVAEELESTENAVQKKWVLGLKKLGELLKGDK